MRTKLILFFLLLITACAPSEQAVKTDNLEKTFFHLSIQDRIGRFHQYSLDDQYRLLIFGNQIAHPPALDLVSEFAKQGQIIVPFLKEKLLAEKEEAAIRDIVATFVELNRLGLYDVKGDTSLMALIAEKANSMHGLWTDTVQDMIGEIAASTTTPI